MDSSIDSWNQTKCPHEIIHFSFIALRTVTIYYTFVCLINNHSIWLHEIYLGCIDKLLYSLCLAKVSQQRRLGKIFFEQIRGKDLQIILICFREQQTESQRGESLKLKLRFCNTNIRAICGIILYFKYVLCSLYTLIQISVGLVSIILIVVALGELEVKSVFNTYYTQLTFIDNDPFPTFLSKFLQLMKLLV